MPIRYKGDRDLYRLPEQIDYLFQKAPRFGTVLERRQLLDTMLPVMEHLTVNYNGHNFSIRPAFTNYDGSPATHFKITGHILFCHLDRRGWYHQRSVRLFDETNKERATGLKRLVTIAESEAKKK